MSIETKQTATLKDGDHLSKHAYLERYEALPEDFRAELLEGIVYVNAAAASAGDHSEPQFLAIRWLGGYYDETPRVRVFGPTTTDIADDSMPEPDICMTIDHPSFGQAYVNERNYLVGPPELIVEVAASSARKDTVTKKRIYENAGGIRVGGVSEVCETAECLSIRLMPSSEFLDPAPSTITCHD